MPQPQSPKAASVSPFDPRTLGNAAFDQLQALRSSTSGDRLKEQKSQAVELYTYLATWGLLRLKAEEGALSQDGKKDVVRAFFKALEKLSETPNLAGEIGLKTLKDSSTEEYLGLTGLALALAREFAFWANALYVGIQESN